MSYAFWLLGTALATAQESPPSDTEGGDVPLAIPISGTPAAAEPQSPPTEAPLPRGEADPPRGDAAHAKAIRTYRDQFLDLRPFDETRVGTTWAYGPYGRRVWPRAYVVHTSGLGVFQGDSRLDVPKTLYALGDEDGRLALERRIASNRTMGNVSNGIGVVGVAASIVGLIALDNCCSTPVVPGDVEAIRQAYTWSTVSITGVALMAGGFLGGTFPMSRAQRLQYDHTATMELDTLEGRIAQHNEELATDLGLTATEAARLESKPPRSARR